MKRVIRFTGVLLLLLILALAAAYYWAYRTTETALARRYSAPRIDLAVSIPQASVETGGYIVNTRNGCIDCHGADLGGKIFIDDPIVGRVVGPNLTPKRLGAWTDDEIAAAIRYGIDRTGRPLMVMPSAEYNHFGRSDLAAVVAYLRSVPPVDRALPTMEVGPASRLLYAIGTLPLLNVEHIDLKHPLSDTPVAAANAQFGEYVARSACSGCHGAEFRGGPIPGGPPNWPPASSLRLGGNPAWSLDGFDRAVRQGVSPIDSRKLAPPMPVAFYANMREIEVRALWAYLSTLR